MRQTHFPFIKYTKWWFILSILIILAGIGAMVNNKVKTGSFMQYGIDFTGGTQMELRFTNNPDNQTNTLATVINGVVPDEVSQITVTDQNSYIIQGKTLTNDQYEAVKDAIKTKIGSFEEVKYNTIGPKIGDTLKQKAIFAISLALIAIVLYLAYAFRKVPKRISPWRFGICAVVALLHDVLSTVGVFALMGYEVDALFITAILTVIGFSVHDTIVVFDRIRENLKFQGRDDSFAQVADLSLNQTLSRSINTSLSTLITLFALYMFGAPSLKTFLFALLFGIFIGTYSSIFIATPMLVLWQGKKGIR
jgi:preprotein translocase subunit SecF